MTSSSNTLAANLRRLRIARQLSLSELARATSVSKATLSAIENATANPTIGTLDALADALHAPISDLLAELPPPAVRVLRAGESPDEPETPRPLDRLVASSGEQLSFSVVRFPPRSRVEYPPRRPGVRLGLFVIEGTLITGPHEQPTEVSTGDYVSFDADTAHLIEVGRETAQIVLVELNP